MDLLVLSTWGRAAGERVTAVVLAAIGGTHST